MKIANQKSFIVQQNLPFLKAKLKNIIEHFSFFSFTQGILLHQSFAWVMHFNTFRNLVKSGTIYTFFGEITIIFRVLLTKTII